MDSNKLEGLSARDVKAKQKKFGYNELPSQGKKNFFKLIDMLKLEMYI